MFPITRISLTLHPGYLKILREDRSLELVAQFAGETVRREVVAEFAVVLQRRGEAAAGAGFPADGDSRSRATTLRKDL